MFRVRYEALDEHAMTDNSKGGTKLIHLFRLMPTLLHVNDNAIQFVHGASRASLIHLHLDFRQPSPKTKEMKQFNSPDHLSRQGKVRRLTRFRAPSFDLFPLQFLGLLGGWRRMHLLDVEIRFKLGRIHPA